MSQIKLSILMPTLTRRRALRVALESEIVRQILGARAEFRQLEDDGEQTSGVKRNALLSQAQGDYVAFVDDDDMISADYVAALLDGISQRQDVVSFWVRRVGSDRPDEIEHFSTGYRDNQPLCSADYPDGLRHVGMQANHLCAWRREIARRVCFPPVLGYCDDVFWYRCAGLFARHESHVDRVLYEYRWNAAETANQASDRVRFAKEWSRGGVRCYAVDGSVLIACRAGDCREAWDCTGKVATIPREATKICEVSV